MRNTVPKVTPLIRGRVILNSGRLSSVMPLLQNKLLSHSLEDDLDAGLSHASEFPTSYRGHSSRRFHTHTQFSLGLEGSVNILAGCTADPKLVTASLKSLEGFPFSETVKHTHIFH